jgi:uncharacterized tellurite resistance protein B-like protein
MLKTLASLKDLFDNLLPQAPGAPSPDSEHLLQLRADATFPAGEREAVLAALRDKFNLTGDEAARLTELAEGAAQQSTDLFTFTSRINDHFDMPAKLRMVEHMWRVAYADSHLSEHERHVMWRIADLLHVPQGAYQHARMRAQQQQQQSS